MTATPPVDDDAAALEALVAEVELIHCPSTEFDGTTYCMGDDDAWPCRATRLLAALRGREADREIAEQRCRDADAAGFARALAAVEAERREDCEMVTWDRGHGPELWCQCVYRCVARVRSAEAARRRDGGGGEGTHGNV